MLRRFLRSVGLLGVLGVISSSLSAQSSRFGSFGEVSQNHQYYPTTDLRLGDDVTLHLGVGFGGTSAGDRLVFKTRFEMPFGGEKN